MSIDAATPGDAGDGDLREQVQQTEPVDDAPAGTRPPTVTARVPAVDVVRDVVAAVALLAALALPWAVGTHTADHVEAVLSLVVALLALPLPYLARAGVLPRGWTLAATRTVRLWAAVPFVVVSVVYVLVDAFHRADPHGVGTGLGLGLAGALLVAQPRACELGPDDRDAVAPRRWRLGLVVLTAVVAVGALAAFVVFLVDAPSLTGNEVVLAACVLLVTFTLGVLPAAALVRGDAAWRTVVVGIGAAAAVLFVAGAGGVRGLVTVESLHALRFGLVLVPAQAAIVAGAAFARTLVPAAAPTAAVSGVADEPSDAAGTDALSTAGGADAGAVDAASADAWAVDAASADAAWPGAASERVEAAAPGRTTASAVLVQRAVVVRTLLVLGVLAALVAISSAVSMGEGARGAAVVVTLVVSALVAVLSGLAAYALRSGSVADGALLTVVVAGAALVAGTVGVVTDSRERAGVPFDLTMVAYGLPAILVVLLTSAAGRAWWGATRDVAAGAAGSYTWVERPRAAARVALTPAPVVAAKAAGVAGPEASDEPEAADASSATEPAADDAFRRPAHASDEFRRPVTGPAVVAAGAGASVAEAPEVEAPAVEAPEVEAPASGVAAGVEGSPSDAPAAAATSSPAADDLGATAVLPAVVTEAGFTAAQAGDPATSLEVLAQIAEHAPSLRPYVASNPATYAALLDWLGGLGDPAVDAALAARGDRQA